jgi:hypothetical protein
VKWLVVLLAVLVVLYVVGRGILGGLVKSIGDRLTGKSPAAEVPGTSNPMMSGAAIP